MKQARTYKQIVDMFVVLAMMVSFVSGCQRPTQTDEPLNQMPDEPIEMQTNVEQMEEHEEEAEMKLNIQIKDTTWTATLADNTSVEAFLELMENGTLTLHMSDYADMEKGADLGVMLPENNEPMHTGPGDITLYQGRTLAIYYDTNSWSLTPIATIDNVDAKELRAVLGKGDVTVTFSRP